MNRCKVCFIGQLCVDSLYIMVIYEIIKIKISHVLEIFHCMSNLEIVVIVVTAVECFMQCIVCNTVQCLAIYPAAVITMDYFAHQPEIRFDFLGSAAECTHKIKIQDIGSVQSDSVHIKFRNPETDHIADIVLDFRITLIQFNKQVVSAPVVIGKPIIIFVVSPEIHITVPVKVLGMLAVLLDIFKCKEITSCVVEDTIKDYFDSLFVTGFYKCSQVFICSKTGIQFFIIGGFIAMSDTLKKWSDVQGSASDLFNMVNPWKKSVQAEYRFCVFVLLWSTGKSKWINVIKNSFVIPTHVSSSRFVVFSFSYLNEIIPYRDKNYGAVVKRQPLSFAISYEIMPEDQQQQVLYQQHFLRI